MSTPNPRAHAPVEMIDAAQALTSALADKYGTGLTCEQCALLFATDTALFEERIAMLDDMRARMCSGHDTALVQALAFVRAALVPS